MKNKIKILIVILFVISNINGQNYHPRRTLTESEKQEIISKIKEINEVDHYYWYSRIIEYKIKEAIPEILKYFWHPEHKMNTSTKLGALGELDYINILDLANQVLDTLNVYMNKGERYTDRERGDGIIERKAYSICFLKEDYSRVNSFINKIKNLDTDELRIYAYSIEILAKNDNYKEILKPYYKKLLYAKDYPSFYIEGYHELYGEPDLAFEKELMETHPNHNLRWIVFDKILRGQKGNEYYYFYKNLLDNPLNEKLYTWIMRRILYYWPSIDNMNYILSKAQLLTQDDKEALGFYLDMKEKDLFFEDYLPEVDSTTTIAEMLDSLQSYNNGCRRVGWILSDVTRDKYTMLINKSKEFNTNNNLYGLKQEIINFQRELSADSLNGAINIIGYSWLSEQSIFILEKLKDVEEPIVIEKTAKQLLEELAAINETNRTTGKYSADWVYTVLKSSIDNGLLMLSLNVPSSSLVIMEQFNITATAYKDYGFINPEGYNLLKTKNDEVIVALKKLTN